MRKVLIVFLVLGAVSMTPGVGGARARFGGAKSVSFKALVPCQELCAYAAPDGAAASAVQTCAHPFPAGSYSDVVVTVPVSMNRLLFEGRPTGDWDWFVCEGSRLRSGFEGAAGSVGAEERIFLPVRPGHRYTIRGYNFSDVFASVGTVRFIQVSS